MADGGVLDRAALDELRTMTGDDAALYVELLDTFLSDADAYFAELTADPDASTLTRAAHSLKSNALSVGATSLAELCRSLETDSRAGTLADGEADARVAAIGAELVLVRPAVIAERDTARSHGA